MGGRDHRPSGASVEFTGDFDAVFNRHFATVFAYLSRRVGASMAEDLAAQTFLEAFRNQAVFRGTVDTARPWLYGIATNLVRRHYRSETRRWSAIARLRAIDDVDDESERAAAKVDIGSRSAAIARALATIAPGDRDVLLLFAWEGLTYDEIAGALGIPIGTVRSRLNRARKRLRHELEDVWRSEVTDG